MTSPDLSVPVGRSLFDGAWTYRSFVNDPDPAVEPNQLLFGQGNLTIGEDANGVLTGALGDTGWTLALTGEATYRGGIANARWQGAGTIGGEPWTYDYFAYYSPTWSNGVDQVPALVGTVVRTVRHGSNPAGFVAQFIAVRKS